MQITKKNHNYTIRLSGLIYALNLDNAILSNRPQLHLLRHSFPIDCHLFLRSTLSTWIQSRYANQRDFEQFTRFPRTSIDGHFNADWVECFSTLSLPVTLRALKETFYGREGASKDGRRRKTWSIVDGRAKATEFSLFGRLTKH